MKVYEIYRGIDKYVGGQKLELDKICITYNKQYALDILQLMKKDDAIRIDQFKNQQVRLFGYIISDGDFECKTLKQYDIYSKEYLKNNQQYCKYKQTYSTCQRNCFNCKGIDNDDAIL